MNPDPPRARRRTPMGSRLGWTSRMGTSAATAAFLAGPALLAETHPVANIFKPLSAPAEAIHEISILALLICTAIFVVVGGLLAYAVVRFRSRPGDDTSEPPQVYGSVQLEMAWTAIPILVVVVLVVATLRTTAAIQNAPLPPDALQVRVVGHQWWWEIEYPGLGIVTARIEIRHAHAAQPHGGNAEWSEIALMHGRSPYRVSPDDRPVPRGPRAELLDSSREGLKGWLPS